MRSKPNPENKWDAKALADLNAEPWQIALFDLNPDYNHWGPGEDSMATGDRTGFSASKTFASWAEFGPWTLDDLNEVVNFHFEIGREAVRCSSCDGSGLNPATQKIAENFYGHSSETGRGWNDSITEDEVETLIEAGRIGSKFDPKTKTLVRTFPAPTASEVNAANARGARGGFLSGMSHDGINRHILIETRAKRLGVYGRCEKCGGKGSIFAAPKAHTTLVLWAIFPRKGASCGVEVRIEQEDLPKVFAFLHEAAQRNAGRFSKIVAP